MPVSHSETTIRPRPCLPIPGGAGISWVSAWRQHGRVRGPWTLTEEPTPALPRGLMGFWEAGEQKAGVPPHYRVWGWTLHASQCLHTPLGSGLFCPLVSAPHGQPCCGLSQPLGSDPHLRRRWLGSVGAGALTWCPDHSVPAISRPVASIPSPDHKASFRRNVAALAA